MRLGKLNNEQLERLVLRKFTHKRKEIITYPGIGRDCCAIDLSGELCVLSTDPITGTSAEIGKLAVNICCNDAAAAGANPIGIMTTLLLPQGTDEMSIAKIADGISAAADELNIDVLGGHTEITDAVNRPIVSVTVIAKAKEGEMISPSGMQQGDALILTKWAGIEGTAIIANDFEKLAGAVLNTEEINQAKGLIDQISVVAEGLCAAKNGATAMHDVTEGGLLGAVWEMAYASSCGVEIHSEAIPVLDITKKLCEKADIDPLKLISSGCMLIACNNCEHMQRALDQLGIKNSLIGFATKNGQVTIDGQQILPPEADELYKLFSSEF